MECILTEDPFFYLENLLWSSNWIYRKESTPEFKLASTFNSTKKKTSYYEVYSYMALFYEHSITTDIRMISSI